MTQLQETILLVFGQHSSVRPVDLSLRFGKSYQWPRTHLDALMRRPALIKRICVGRYALTDRGADEVVKIKERLACA